MVRCSPYERVCCGAGERPDAGARQGGGAGGAGPVVHRRRQRQDDARPRRLGAGAYIYIYDII